VCIWHMRELFRTFPLVSSTHFFINLTLIYVTAACMGLIQRLLVGNGVEVSFSTWVAIVNWLARHAHAGSEATKHTLTLLMDSPISRESAPDLFILSSAVLVGLQ
jgi:hypothetical protein